MRTHNIPPCYRKIKEILVMPPDLALLSTLIGSNYPCLELIFMVPKVLKPLKFDCIIILCTTIHRYPIFSTRYSVMCKVYTGYCGTSEIEHGLCACTVDNPLAKARGLSLRTGAQTMLYLSLVSWPC